jgi:type VI secretion system protein ImpE
MPSPVELFKSDRLTDAVALATDAVRNKPMDVAARSLLCELLCFAGELERADKQLDAALQADPQTMTGVSLLKHLIRSEFSRREVFRHGRVPEFIALPTTAQQKRLESLLHLRTGDPGTAGRLISEATELEVERTGTVNGQPVQGVWDLDELLGPTLEVYTATGKYYWIGFDQIVSLELAPVSHLTDMLWRSAAIETTGDVSGRVHIPVLYEGSETSADERVRIGSATEWNTSGEGAPTRGAGQRELLAGEDVLPFLQIQTLSFNN